MLTECFLNCSIALFSGHRVIEHDRPIHLAIHINRGHRDEIESFVVNADEFVSDDSVKQALRAHGVKTWGKGTDVKALQSMLAHDAGQRRA